MPVTVSTLQGTQQDSAAPTIGSYYTVDQVARELACSTQFVYELVERGDLDAEGEGEALRFNPDAVRAYHAHRGPGPVVPRMFFEGTP